MYQAMFIIEYIMKYTGFAIGGVPPIGYELEIRPLIDEDLMAYEDIWAAAGTPFSVFRLSSKNLLTCIVNIHKL